MAFCRFPGGCAAPDGALAGWPPPPPPAAPRRPAQKGFRGSRSEVMHRGQAVQHGLKRLGQGLVGRRGAGPKGVAAVFGDDLPMQEGEGRRRGAEGHVGVPELLFWRAPPRCSPEHARSPHPAPQGRRDGRTAARNGWPRPVAARAQGAGRAETARRAPGSSPRNSSNRAASSRASLSETPLR